MIANIIFAVVIVFTIYALALTFSHMPIFGVFLFAPLILCMAMMMFMGHGDEKKHAAHKH